MKYVYEFIGTFFLVLTVGMMVLINTGAGVMAPLAIGMMLAVMIYAGAHVSGAHYNPAVSLAIFLRGKLTADKMVGYWVAQTLAGVAAAYLAVYIKGGVTDKPLVLNPLHAVLIEALFTFGLCFIVLNVATTTETKGNSFYGFAIGFFVVAGAYAVGTLSGAVFNPAVALGITIMNLAAWSEIWIYLVGNFVGAIAAALLFKAAHPAE